MRATNMTHKMPKLERAAISAVALPSPQFR